MYTIIKGAEVIATKPSLCWLKRQDNGVFIRTNAAEGQAVLVDDTIYTVRGQAEVEGYDVVDIVQVQDAAAGGDDRLNTVEAQLAAITAAVERGMQ